MSLTRDRVRGWVDSSRFQWFIIAVILINSAVLGLETSADLIDRHPWITTTGQVTVAIFVVEIGLRIFAHRRAFFHDPWSLFDLFIVLVALIPASGSASVLRALRVLRVLRLLSTVRSMRRVVSALVATVPGMASIGALLVMLLYVAGVVSTQLFGPSAPAQFGDLPTALLSLFQVMTGDNWGTVVRPVTDVHPEAWLFFITFMLVSTYIVLNLFIAVAVEALDRQKDPETAGPDLTRGPDLAGGPEAATLAAIAELQAEIRQLRTEVEAARTRVG